MLALLLAALVTVAWDPQPGSDPVDGYQVLVWAVGAVTPTQTLDVGHVLQTDLDLNAGDAVTVQGYAKDCADTNAPCALFVYSYPSARVFVPLADPADPQCQAPFGAEAISLFFTGYVPTTGKANSLSNIRFQLASHSPIVRLEARLDGNAASSLNAGAQVSGLWFPLSAQPGTKVLTVYAQNAYGCAGVVPYPIPIVVAP